MQRRGKVLRCSHSLFAISGDRRRTMTTNDINSRNSGESVEEEVVLKNGFVTFVKDASDEWAEKLGRARFYLGVQTKVTLEDGSEVKLSLAGHHLLTKVEINLLRELLQEFEVFVLPKQVK